MALFIKEASTHIGQRVKRKNSQMRSDNGDVLSKYSKSSSEDATRNDHTASLSTEYKKQKEEPPNDTEFRINSWSHTSAWKESLMTGLERTIRKKLRDLIHTTKYRWLQTFEEQIQGFQNFLEENGKEFLEKIEGDMDNVISKIKPIREFYERWLASYLKDQTDGLVAYGPLPAPSVNTSWEMTIRSNIRLKEGEGNTVPKEPITLFGKIISKLRSENTKESGAERGTSITKYSQINIPSNVPLEMNGREKSRKAAFTKRMKLLSKSSLRNGIHISDKALPSATRNSTSNHDLNKSGVRNNNTDNFLTAVTGSNDYFTEISEKTRHNQIKASNDVSTHAFADSRSRGNLQEHQESRPNNISDYKTGDEVLSSLTKSSRMDIQPDEINQNDTGTTNTETSKNHDTNLSKWSASAKSYNQSAETFKTHNRTLIDQTAQSKNKTNRVAENISDQEWKGTSNGSSDEDLLRLTTSETKRALNERSASDSDVYRHVLVANSSHEIGNIENHTHKHPVILADLFNVSSYTNETVTLPSKLNGNISNDRADGDGNNDTYPHLSKTDKSYTKNQTYYTNVTHSTGNSVSLPLNISNYIFKNETKDVFTFNSSAKSTPYSNSNNASEQLHEQGKKMLGTANTPHNSNTSVTSFLNPPPTDEHNSFTFNHLMHKENNRKGSQTNKIRTHFTEFNTSSNVYLKVYTAGNDTLSAIRKFVNWDNDTIVEGTTETRNDSVSKSFEYFDTKLHSENETENLTQSKQSKFTNKHYTHNGKIIWNSTLHGTKTQTKRTDDDQILINKTNKSSSLLPKARPKSVNIPENEQVQNKSQDIYFNKTENYFLMNQKRSSREKFEAGNDSKTENISDPVIYLKNVYNVGIYLREKLNTIRRKNSVEYKENGVKVLKSNHTKSNDTNAKSFLPTEIKLENGSAKLNLTHEILYPETKTMTRNESLHSAIIDRNTNISLGTLKEKVNIKRVIAVKAIRTYYKKGLKLMHKLNTLFETKVNIDGSNATKRIMIKTAMDVNNQTIALPIEGLTEIYENKSGMHTKTNQSDDHHNKIMGEISDSDKTLFKYKVSNTGNNTDNHTGNTGVYGTKEQVLNLSQKDTIVSQNQTWYDKELQGFLNNDQNSIVNAEIHNETAINLFPDGNHSNVSRITLKHENNTQGKYSGDSMVTGKVGQMFRRYYSDGLDIIKKVYSFMKKQKSKATIGSIPVKKKAINKNKGRNSNENIDLRSPIIIPFIGKHLRKAARPLDFTKQKQDRLIDAEDVDDKGEEPINKVQGTPNLTDEQEPVMQTSDAMSGSTSPHEYTLFQKSEKIKDSGSTHKDEQRDPTDDTNYGEFVNDESISKFDAWGKTLVEFASGEEIELVSYDDYTQQLQDVEIGGNPRIIGNEVSKDFSYYYDEDEYEYNEKPNDDNAYLNDSRRIY